MLKNTKGVCFLLLVCASEADNLRGNLNCFKVRLSNLIVDNFASCLCVSLYALFACSFAQVLFGCVYVHCICAKRLQFM